MENDRLLDIIDTKTLTATTGAIDISFGEIASMYPDELEIKPVYQRLFRWSETQQSQFIESLILELPIPPIFVIETESRKYDLIDGLQRISSFLHFMGILGRGRYPENHKLKLQNCDIVKELNGLTFDNLSPALRIKVKRSYVRMQIIRKESPKRLKYDMFKRLNTGGSLLSAQEIRNSTIRLLDESFIDFIQRLKNNKDFKEAISYVMDEQINEQFDDELVLRYFTLKNANLQKFKGTLADYMTQFSEQIADKDVEFDYKTEKVNFEKTFALLNKILPKGAIFVHYSERGFQKQFLAFHYEAFSIAVSKYIDELSIDNTEIIRKLMTKFAKLKNSKKFQEITKNEKEKRTSGSKYLKYLNERIDAVESVIKEVL
ncbi:DUF262 domain-containing protein [Prolixibacter sp. NT017]|uniref:DUF262 domain-containing protein n=1 Tax=Prolixibacter sp. NT017 TaxID=2652390 RepID=UPI0012730C09|nr:DUF262 domain-containing protein [Prolixibacter sp. NT017]GET25649.1 hypothetical protein NT017_19780 [Prolixibacter sp. NT017]